jgi:hypothetical protein
MLDTVYASRKPGICVVLDDERGFFYFERTKYVTCRTRSENVLGI